MIWLALLIVPGACALLIGTACALARYSEPKPFIRPPAAQRDAQQEIERRLMRSIAERMPRS